MRALLLSTVLLVSCGHKSTSDSEWGKLKGNDPTFMDLAPGAKVLICGDYQKQANNALWEINQIVAREFRVTGAYSCATYRKYQASIQTFQDGYYCREEGVLGYHTQEAKHHSIVICPLARGTEAETILHEVVHAWGVCDQYSEVTTARAFNSNCDSRFRSKKAGVSIMNAGSSDAPKHLTPDDVLGLRVMACRSNWNNYQWSIPTSWKTSALKTEILRLEKNYGYTFLTGCK